MIELTGPLGRVRRVFYGWWLVGIAAFVLAVGIVPFSQSMPAWFVVLKADFPSWSRGQMSWAFALTRIEGGLLGPVEGMLIDRLGSRRMVLIGMTLVGCGLLIFSQINELWHLYFAYLVMSLGVGLGIWLPMITALNNWFIRRRAVAMGLAIQGWFIGAILLVPALAWAIDPDADRIGWRATAAGIGVTIILLALPISRLVRNRPEDYGQRADGDIVTPAPATLEWAETRQSGLDEGDFTWREAIRTRPFWMISLGHACLGCVMVTITVHMGLMLQDRGFSLQMIAWVVAAQQFVSAIFTLVGGYIGDRVPIRVATFGFATLQSVAVIVLLLAQNAPTAFLFAVILGIGFGGRSPLTAAIRGVYFGRRDFASITGISMIPQNVLLFAAPLFAGYMFDATQSYAVPFVTVAVLNLLGSCLFLLMGDPTPAPSSRLVPVRT